VLKKPWNGSCSGTFINYQNNTNSKQGVKIMDMIAIVKEYVDLQKRSANNLFDAVRLFQDFADNRNQYWVDQMSVDGKIKTVVDEWRVVFKKGCEDSIKLVNVGFKSMETYLDELSHQEKESQPTNSAEQSLGRGVRVPVRTP
jgi:predicted transcriptional regulator